MFQGKLNKYPTFGVNDILVVNNFSVAMDKY